MRVFINPSGQRENLGDSVLRRAYLDELRQCGQLHVLAGDHAAYVSGLGLHAGDRVYSSKREWLSEALVHSRRERSVFAVNAGEVVTGRNYASTYAWQSALARAIRRGGGHTVAMGIANRENPKLTRPLLARFTRRADLVTWRDGEAARMYGVGSVQPDWATALGQKDLDRQATSARDTIAITLRGDRALPDEIWFSAVKRALSALGSPRVVAVVQVMRDTPRAHDLVQRFGGTVLHWPEERSHADQESLLREVYRSSRAVISDRIHALIIGMTEGAVPIGFTPHSAQKVSKTFAAISPSTPAWSANADLTLEQHTTRIVNSIELGSRVWPEIADARMRLRRKSMSLHDVVHESNRSAQ